jgi:hypothetical protein
MTFYLTYFASVSTSFSIIFLIATLLFYTLRLIFQTILEGNKNFNERLKKKFSLFLNILFIFEGGYMILFVFFINTFLLFAIFLKLNRTHIMMSSITFITIFLSSLHIFRERNLKLYFEGSQYINFYLEKNFYRKIPDFDNEKNINLYEYEEINEEKYNFIQNYFLSITIGIKRKYYHLFCFSF